MVVSIRQLNGMLLFDGPDSVLEMVSKDPDTFRLLPDPSNADSCFTQEIGDLFQLLRFTRSEGSEAVTGFEMDIHAPCVFKKTS